MKSSEAKSIAARAAFLFQGKFTAAVRDHFARQIQDLPAAFTDKAIDNYHSQTEASQFDVNALLSRCKEFAAMSAAPAQARPAESVKPKSEVELYRERAPNAFRDRCDAEVFIRVYRDWWVRSSRSEIWSNKVLGELKPRLVACGMPQSEADSWAQLIFTDDVSFFAVSLNYLRDNPPKQNSQQQHASAVA